MLIQIIMDRRTFSSVLWAHRGKLFRRLVMTKRRLKLRDQASFFVRPLRSYILASQYRKQVARLPCKGPSLTDGSSAGLFSEDSLSRYSRNQSHVPIRHDLMQITLIIVNQAPFLQRIMFPLGPDKNPPLYIRSSSQIDSWR